MKRIRPFHPKSYMPLCRSCKMSVKSIFSRARRLAEPYGNHISKCKNPKFRERTAQYHAERDLNLVSTHSSTNCCDHFPFFEECGTLQLWQLEYITSKRQQETGIRLALLDCGSAKPYSHINANTDSIRVQGAMEHWESSQEGNMLGRGSSYSNKSIVERVAALRTTTLFRRPRSFGRKGSRGRAC